MIPLDDRADDGSDGPRPDEVVPAQRDHALIERIRAGIPLPRGAGPLARTLVRWRADVLRVMS